MPIERIEQLIILIRGKKVMLAVDLAVFYDVETRAPNQAVKRNIERFPPDFMFTLTRAEIKRISQFVTSSGRYKKIKFSKSVTAFSEHGVSMLSGVLNSPRAIQVNIQIMRTFARLREILASHGDLARKLDSMEKKYDEQFRVVFDAIRELMKPARSRIGKIGFNSSDT